MGLLNDASEWLTEQMQVSASPAGTITYIRGETEIDLTGLAWTAGGPTSRRNLAEFGPAVEFAERDYMIPVVDLPDIDPAKGDRIEETIGEVVTKWDVLPPTSGEPAARHSDHERTVWRVHCKRARGS
jgi:hypothetical protein